ncbi:hypothetical protein [Lacrimispora defluvii]|jgi:hypothetical protein|uniref:Uncharacterized protein n=1 Tax=Lacrimispora defluvii TaxID=2719233 RepID=A0ABX1VY75_9FIRM|nr:hypothetical protein [Lacrimispora defluvii]NNJ33370.1 hypothetical protein [Lacrimispora defluvii]
MQVLQIILIIIPGVMATYIYEFKKKCNLNAKDWLYNSAKFILVIFWLINLIQYLRGWGSFDWTKFSVQFILKYIPLASMLAVILPHIQLYLDLKINSLK